MSNPRDIYHNVYHANMGLKFKESILKELGLTPGQTINSEQMLACIKLDAIACVADMSIQRLAGNAAFDTSSLEATLLADVARR